MSQRGGFLSRLLAVGFIAGVVWVYGRSWWPVTRFTTFSGRLENTINSELTGLGLGDDAILSTVHKEHSYLGVRWIETQREIELTDSTTIPVILKQLRNAAERMGCHLIRERTIDGGALVRIRWHHVLLQQLLFRVSGGLAAIKSPQIAVVIDDVAHDLGTMDRYAALSIPLTFAVLPRERHSRELAKKAHQANFSVILHLPMEPQDIAHNDPGSAALLLRMSQEELKAQFDKNVDSVPHLVGINNHMGSAFTENENQMTLVLQWIKERGLFFLDSRTSMQSVAGKVAKRLKLRCRSNETFLDNEDNLEAIEKQLDKALVLALQRKQTIAIGHYRRKYLVEALAKKIPEFKAKGVRFVPITAMYSTKSK